MSMKSKLLRGSLWSAGSQFTSQFIRFGLTMVLAYLLGPDAFGLLGMVLVITGFLGYFTEFGLIASLVQKKEVDELDCNTVFWSSIFLSVVLYAIVYFCAPLVAMFYDKPQLTLITRVIFIDFLMKPFSFVPSALELKKIKYNLISISGIISVSLSAVVALILAFNGYGVWTLVIQHLSLTFFSVVLLWSFTRWIPKLEFSFARFKELFSFGAHVTLNNVIKFFSENIDYLIVGKLLGETELGIYQLAFRLSRYPLERIWTFFGKMLFPAFSTFQNNIVRLRRNFMRVSISGGVALLPPLLIILFGADSIISLLGEKWDQSMGLMSNLITIFAGYLIFQSVCYADESIMMALKKVYIVNIYKSVASALLLGLGFFAVKYFGLKGMAWVYMITTLLYIAVMKVIITRMLGLKISYFLKNTKCLLFYLAGLAIVAMGVSYFLSERIGDILFLMILGASVGLTSLAFLYVLKVIKPVKPFFEIDEIIDFETEVKDENPMEIFQGTN